MHPAQVQAILAMITGMEQQLGAVKGMLGATLPPRGPHRPQLQAENYLNDQEEAQLDQMMAPPGYPPQGYPPQQQPVYPQQQQYPPQGFQPPPQARLAPNQELLMRMVQQAAQSNGQSEAQPQYVAPHGFPGAVAQQSPNADFLRGLAHQP